MSLPQSLNDREYQKFVDFAVGETAVRVTGSNFSGTFSQSGLSIAGKITVVTLNDTTWVALPPTPLTDRNGLSIQNQSGKEIKLQYDNTTVGYVGPIVNPSSERFYDIKDTILIYGKCSSGTCDIIIEELS
jgi:hypothetical protein